MIRTLKYLNIIFFLFMICINALANMLPIGHGNTGSISNKYPNLFTPAPITFSIWGIIYLLVGLFVVYQVGFIGNESLSDVLIELIGPWFVMSCIMNIGWLLSWHYDKTFVSLIFMLLLLLSLINITTSITPAMIRQTTGISDLDFLAKITIIGFDIYLGWIVAATIANISVLLTKYEWNRFGLSEQFWMVIVLVVGALLGILFILARQKYMSSAAIIWAYCGILVKHISQEGYAGRYPLIITVTIVCIVAILCAGIIKAIMNTRVMG